MGVEEKYIDNLEEIESIIRQCNVCRLGMAIDNDSYVVPVCFGYYEQRLYIHTGLKGRKIVFFESNPKLCIEFEKDVRLISDSNNPCAWSMAYISVIGTGRIREFCLEDEKIFGLGQIMKQYSSHSLVIPREELDSVRVWGIDIDSLTAKRSEH